MNQLTLVRNATSKFGIRTFHNERDNRDFEWQRSVHTYLHNLVRQISPDLFV